MNSSKSRTYRDWAAIELEIQRNGRHKDWFFRPGGDWKTFYMDRYGFKLFVVDVDWVNVNLSIAFGHGGHGMIHEFIPHDEIWVSDLHPSTGCFCKGVIDRQLSPRFRESTILHEVEEWRWMMEGMPFDQAHQLALKAEMSSSWLKNPYEEDYSEI